MFHSLDAAFQAGDFGFYEILHVGKARVHGMTQVIDGITQVPHAITQVTDTTIHSIPQIVNTPVLKVEAEEIASDDDRNRAPVRECVHDWINSISPSPSS